MNPGLRKQIEDNLIFFSDAETNPSFMTSALRYIRDVRALLTEIDRLTLMLQIATDREKGWIGERTDEVH